MQVTSLLRSIFVAGAVAGVPASLAAQSCMGYALAPNQHAASFVIAGQPEGIDPGPGGSISGVLKNNASYAFQTSLHYIDMGSVDFEHMYLWNAQVARPVLRKTADASAGPCVLLELGGSSFMETTSTNGGVGFGYSLNAPKYALFAAPFAGMVQSGEFSDTYVKLLFGGGTRLGALHLGMDVNVPVAPSGGETTWNLRVGFAWGKATAIPATPVRTTGTTENASQAAIVTPAVSAGTKPYTIDDIEAMVKNAVPTPRILDLSKKACLSFRMNDVSETRLRRIGADAELLNGLRTSCYAAS